MKRRRPTGVIPFVKAEADGNDFLLVPATAVAPAERALVARSLCDRRRGIGADGVEWWRFSPRRRVLRLELHNADGSAAEISGNGTRCGVAWCVERFGVDTLAVITGAGRKQARRLEGPPDGIAAGKGEVWIEIDMGKPGFSPEAIPATAPGRTIPVCDWPLEAAGREWKITALSMGNPQCCALVDAFPQDWADVAAALGRNAAFPRQANVELVRVLGRHEIEIRICERGAGVTPSSGTGSCAAAVTAILAGRAASPLRVRTQGGVQQVLWDGMESGVRLQGPARIVAAGRWAG